jgi:unsaturated rhamnogalacturonyl hydrolase
MMETVLVPDRVQELGTAHIHSVVQRLISNLVELKDPSGEFLLKLDDGRIIDTKGWNDWEWTHGIGLYGIHQYYQLSGEKRCLQIIEDWFRDRFKVGTPSKNVNTMAAFLTLANLYEQYGERTYLPYLDTWAEWVMHDMPRTEEGGLQHIVFNSENPQQLWDDTLMMCVLPLARIGQILHRPHYVEEACRQFMLHIKYLHDRRTGLWFHGWTFDGRHNFAEARWARGNCWVTIAIPEFVEMLDLQPGDALREILLTTLEAQVRELAKLQDASGLWHTLLDDPTSYLEASATAGFAYGILKAVRRRYLPSSYAEVGMRAVRAVLNNISDDGELKNVSFGTAMGSDLEFYRRIPLTSMPYGQAMAMLALCETLRTRI